MARYRKKPVVIDAWRWEGDPKVLLDMLQAGEKDYVYPQGMRYNEETKTVLVETLEGTMACNVGDWIIRGISGEFYPIKDAIFRATYEEVQQ